MGYSFKIEPKQWIGIDLIFRPIRIQLAEILPLGFYSDVNESQKMFSIVYNKYSTAYHGPTLTVY